MKLFALFKECIIVQRCQIARLFPLKLINVSIFYWTLMKQIYIKYK